jgi:plastocyanin
VVYDGDRFIPEKVTVIVGGAVRFVNTSDKEMWIASDNHPTHTRYPVKSETDCKGSSFDQCVAVGSGGSWSFTFTRTGTWGYHNHMRAQDNGDVVVRTEEEYLKSI